MALRVLLADESSSIKRVMQLALQDFGVEVKAVPVGLDVVSVTRSWSPDIIFVDTLLAKMSGYDVSAALKNTPDLKHLPIVLMWSSFLEVDEKKAQASQANRRLEKPFDAETLRAIVKELVPAVNDNALSNYLSFPNLPDFVEKQQAPPAHFAASTSTPVTHDDHTVIMDDLDDPEDFSQVPLPNLYANRNSNENHTDTHTDNSTEPWKTDNLDRFKIQIPKDDYGNFEENFGNIEDASIVVTGAGHGQQELHMSDLDDVVSTSNTKNRPISSTFESSSSHSSPSLDPAHAEHILREQVRAVLQEIAWKVIPDIAERIVREEIQKLLKDAEKLS
jgi:two-component system cell cycle response regulator